jgi:uncharacterized membrane protein YeaQ/YmgE (transglycosylase-associated protein family)
MNPIACVLWLVVGAISGTVAGRLLRGRGYGPVGDLALGLVGSMVGGFVFGLLGIQPGGLLAICGQIIIAAIGAVLFVWGVRLFVDADFAA